MFSTVKLSNPGERAIPLPGTNTDRPINNQVL